MEKVKQSQGKNKTKNTAADDIGDKETAYGNITSEQIDSIIITMS